MRRFKAILFDFDGVIARTMEDNFNAWAHAFRVHGVEIGKQDYFLLEGATPREVAETFSRRNSLSPDLSAQLVAAKERHYLENSDFAFYPGAEDLLRTLKTHKYLIGLVSGAGRARLQATCPDAFLEQFDVVVTADDIDRGKPAPAPYLKAALALGLSPFECLVVENAPLGIRSAKAASMTCVAVCSTLDRAHLGGADAIFDSIDELLPILAPAMDAASSTT